MPQPCGFEKRGANHGTDKFNIFSADRFKFSIFSVDILANNIMGAVDKRPEY